MHHIEDQLVHWRDGRGRLHERLAAALRSAVGRGELAPGTPLPAERRLAEALDISRGTVVAALDALAGEGLVDRRRGSGTFIAVSSGAVVATRSARRPRVAEIGRDLAPGTIDMTHAAPGGTGVIDAELWRSAFADIDGLLTGSGFAHPRGTDELRTAVADHMVGWGIPHDPERVTIVTGAQQGLTMLAGAMLGPGDRVLVERFTWPGAIDAFRAAGATLVPVASDASGPVVEALEHALAHTRPTLVYLCATVGNPTGVTIPKMRRLRILEACARHGVPVVDDCTSHDVCLAPPPPALAGCGTDADVITVGSMSKLFWGGLRVGWLHTRAEAVARLAELKRAADLGTSLPAQAVATRLLRERAGELRARRVAEIQARHDVWRAGAADLLPEWQYADPSGGYALWVRLPVGDGREFTRVALREGVAVLPGRLVSADGSGADAYLRLAPVHDPATTAVAIERLARAWAAYLPMARPTLVVEVDQVIV